MTAVSKSSQVLLSRFRLFKYQITTGVVCIDESRECEEEEWRYIFNLVWELPSNIYFESNIFTKLMTSQEIPRDLKRSK